MSIGCLIDCALVLVLYVRNKFLTLKYYWIVERTFAGILIELYNSPKSLYCESRKTLWKDSWFVCSKYLYYRIFLENSYKVFWRNVSQKTFPANIYLLKVNNRNYRTTCEICSKLTIMTPEWRQWHRSGVFIVNFGHISHLTLVFLLLTSNMYLLAGSELLFLLLREGF